MYFQILTPLKPEHIQLCNKIHQIFNSNGLQIYMFLYVLTVSLVNAMILKLLHPLPLIPEM
jgi:hypothetical protein